MKSLGISLEKEEGDPEVDEKTILTMYSLRIIDHSADDKVKVEILKYFLLQLNKQTNKIVTRTEIPKEFVLIEFFIFSFEFVISVHH